MEAPSSPRKELLGSNVGENSFHRSSSLSLSGTKSVEAKIVLLGMQGVGKSSLIVRYVQNTFTSSVPSTIGASLFTHKTNVDGFRVKFQIWDTAGQERFRSMAPMYYRGANAAILVYDINNRTSFNEVADWVRELRENGSAEILCLLANKIDSKNSESVSTEEGLAYAQSIKAIYHEVSAKLATGVNEAFLQIAKDIIRIKSEAAEDVLPPLVVSAPPPEPSKPCCGSNA